MKGLQGRSAAGPHHRPVRPAMPGGSSTTSSSPGLKDIVAHTNRIWRGVKHQQVNQDLQTGICTAPKQPGQVGRSVKLLSNHLAVTTSAPAASRHVYVVELSTEAPGSVNSQQQPEPDGQVQEGVPLESRQALVAQLAGQQGWAEGSWQYDSFSNTLYTIDPVTTGSSDTLQASVAAPGTPKGKQQTWNVSITRSTSTPGAQGAGELQLLGLLSKASLLAFIQRLGGVAGGRGGLLPPNVLGLSTSSFSPAGAPAGRGAGRGGGRGGRGGGRGGARGPRSNFPGVLQFWDSVSTGIKPTQEGLTLQLNTTAGAVLPGKPLGSLLTVPGVSDPSDLTRNKKLLAEAELLLKGAKVRADYFPSGPQTLIIKSLDARPAGKFSFELDGKATTVAAYFKKAYSIQLKHADDWPCVMISKTAAIPMELLTVLPTPRKNLTESQTAELIRIAALPPNRRLTAYKAVLQKLVSGWQLFKQWGVNISTDLMQVDGRVLPDTALQYANSSGVKVNNQGQWRAGSSAKLLAPAALTTWAVLNLASQRYSNRAVTTFASQLKEEMQRQGMKVQQPFAVHDSSSSSGGVGTAFDAVMQDPAGRMTQLVLVVLPEKGTSLYKQVKQEALQRGLVTQCVVAPQAKIQEDAPSRNVPYLNNVLLKINAKLGGINWQLPQGPSVWAPLFGTQQLMVMGVDVCHGVTSSKSPSVAAVVGSQDPACTQYTAAILEQTPGHEVVLGMREAARDLLQSYYSSRGQLPEAILVFRDGVSDSQYAAVLQQEVADIRAACAAVGGPAGAPPKVTYVVVSKNHGTRLFPTDAADSLKGNVMPGTVVDTQLVAPLRFEMLLNSHAGIQGTNRPLRVNVLVDDNKLGPDGIQLLTYHLSSIYCNCTRTLSDPAPARYAHKAAAAGSFISSSAQWQVVQPAQPGMQQLQYRLLTTPGVLPGTMWYV